MDTSIKTAQLVKEFTFFIDQEIRPIGAQNYEEDNFPRSIIDKIAQMGYLGAPFPGKYGGLDFSPFEYGLLTKELAKACNASRTLLTVHTSLVGETILRLGSDRQKSTWLPQLASGEKIAAFALSEANSGSDAGAMKTTYQRRGDTFILNGKKKWISFGNIADTFLLAAMGENGMSAFLVDRAFAGVTTKPITELFAGKATHIAEVYLTDVEVPLSNLVSREGAGFAYVMNTALDYGRYSIAWAGLGMMEEAVDCMAGYISTKAQFGQKLYNFQLIQGIFADAVTQLEAARALCGHTARARTLQLEDAVMYTNMAKYFTSKSAVKVTGDAVQVLGANGFSKKYAAARLFTEAKVLEVIEGASQIQQTLIATHGLQKYFKSYHGFLQDQESSLV